MAKNVQGGLFEPCVSARFAYQHPSFETYAAALFFFARKGDADESREKGAGERDPRRERRVKPEKGADGQSRREDHELQKNEVRVFSHSAIIDVNFRLIPLPKRA